MRAMVAEAIGDAAQYDFELLEPLAGGTESPTDSPLYEACASFVSEQLPGAELLPIIAPGFSDSYWIRRWWETTAYGFAPVFSTDPDLYSGGIHAADESIDTADLVTMTDLAEHAIGSLSATG